MLLSLLLALSVIPPDLTVLGVVVSSLKERSVAILASGGRTRVVGVGEVAFGGRVVEVGDTGVSLDFDGKHLELRLAAAAAAPAPGAMRAPATAPPPQGTSTGLSLPRAEMERRLGLELDRILAETALRPVGEGDEVKGFALSRIPEGTLLTDAGLRAGDVLTEINGVPIDSLATLIALYPRLQTESQVRATVIRDGQPLSLTLSLR
jgi:general secretion pathway protein C